MKRGVAVAVAVLVSLWLPASPGVAHDDDLIEQPDAVFQHNCHEVFPFVEVAYAAANDLVSPGYMPLRTPSGNGLLQIATRHCDSLTVDGRSVPDAIDSYITVAIEPPYEDTDAVPHPSFLTLGEHDDSADDPAFTRLELYIVQWVTNSAMHASWLKERTGLGDRVKLVPTLVYDYRPAPGFLPGAVDASFHFEAPPPAPSPFHVDAVVIEPGPVAWDVGQNMWAETGTGTVNIFGEHHRDADQLFAAADGTVASRDSASPLGITFGQQQTRRFSDSVEKAFSSGAFTDGQWTKCIRNVATPCTRENH